MPLQVLYNPYYQGHLLLKLRQIKNSLIYIKSPNWNRNNENLLSREDCILFLLLALFDTQKFHIKIYFSLSPLYNFSNWSVSLRRRRINYLKLPPGICELRMRNAWHVCANAIIIVTFIYTDRGTYINHTYTAVQYNRWGIYFFWTDWHGPEGFIIQRKETFLLL